LERRNPGVTRPLRNLDGSAGSARGLGALQKKFDAPVTNDAPRANQSIGVVELGLYEAHSDHPFRLTRSGSRESLAMRASSRTPKLRPRKKSQLELLEDRRLLATIAVKTTADETAAG
jgi:hypothetical protein